MKRFKPKCCDRGGPHQWDNRVQGRRTSDEKPVGARSALIQDAPVELKSARIKAARSNTSTVHHQVRAPQEVWWQSYKKRKEIQAREGNNRNLHEPLSLMYCNVMPFSLGLSHFPPTKLHVSRVNGKIIPLDLEAIQICKRTENDDNDISTHLEPTHAQTWLCKQDTSPFLNHMTLAVYRRQVYWYFVVHLQFGCV